MEASGLFKPVQGLLHLLLLTKYYLGDPIKKNEMVGACGTYVGQERCIEGFGGETLGEETTWTKGIDGRIIIKWISKKWDREAWAGLIWIRIGKVVGRL